MAKQIIREFLTKTFSTEDFYGYIAYILNNVQPVETVGENWMSKMDSQRDLLIDLNILDCFTCGNQFAINLVGDCECINGHDGSEQIANEISRLSWPFQ